MRIVADELSRNFGNTHALSDVSIALDPGKIHALVGENGAEKSTLLKILAGAEQPDSGRMVVDGEPYAPRSVMDATGRGVGLVFQEITINPSLTVAENIFAGRLAGFRRHGLLRGSALNRAAQVLLDSFSAEISVSQPMSTLDLGQWKCIEVARALSASPQAVLFDESTAFLNHREVDIVLDAMRSLKRQGLVVAFVSHHLAEVGAVADGSRSSRMGARSATTRPTRSAATRSRASWSGGTCRRVSSRPTRRRRPRTISCALTTSRMSASSRVRSRSAAARLSGSRGSKERVVSASWRSPLASRRLHRSFSRRHRGDRCAGRCQNLRQHRPLEP